MAEQQVIPARHGTATFVPAGQVIKIINSSGSQVIDTWAFALPKPEPKETPKSSNDVQQDQEETTQDQGQTKQDQGQTKQDNLQKTQSKTKKQDVSLPTQEEAEQTTKQAMKQGEETSTPNQSTQHKTWGSYVPSMPRKIWPSSKKGDGQDAQQESEQKKDSKTWASYFPSGQGFSNYIPKSVTDTGSAFVASHHRDPNKSYLEQLQDLSRTPVGAAGWAGLAALTGSGWGGSTFAGYQAWNAQNAAHATPVEFMSMTHTRSSTLHIRPQVNDTLVSNLREPVLTLIEDTSRGIHDTLIAACDPARYKNLGVENWQQHGSCAENLVLALEELNKRAGLKGAKAVGADLTINTVPAPLNLFMNIPWDDSGNVSFEAPQCKKNDYVRLKAERDVVVVMSSCPQDILPINNHEPTDAHFLVEGEEDTGPAVKRTQSASRKRPPPRKISSSHATSTVGTETNAPTSKRPAPARKTVPQRRPNTATPAKSTANQGQAQPAQQTQTQSKKATQPAKPPQKKPVPPPVAAQKTSSAANGGESNTQSAPATEKKKPRKLNAKKPEAQSAG